MPTQVVFEPVDVWDVEEGGFYWLQTGEEPKDGRKIYITENPQLGQPAMFMYLAVYLGSNPTPVFKPRPGEAAVNGTLFTAPYNVNGEDLELIRTRESIKTFELSPDSKLFELNEPMAITLVQGWCRECGDARWICPGCGGVSIRYDRVFNSCGFDMACPQCLGLEFAIEDNDYHEQNHPRGSSEYWKRELRMMNRCEELGYEWTLPYDDALADEEDEVEGESKGVEEKAQQG